MCDSWYSYVSGSLSCILLFFGLLHAQILCFQIEDMRDELLQVQLKLQAELQRRTSGLESVSSMGETGRGGRGESVIEGEGEG